MSNFSVDILQIRKSSFETGVEMGNHIRHKPILKALESITKQEIDIRNMESIFSAFAPHLLEELEGLSHSLELPYHKTASLFSGYDVPKTDAMGCSAILTKDYYVRNYDFSPTLYDGLFSMLQPDKSLATAGYNLQILGRHDGVNEEGLAAGLHFVSNDGYRKGLSAWTSIRMVLDSCATTEDAIDMLKEIPHAACYNFSLGDRKGGRAEVEASPEKVIVRRDKSTLSCVNHFQEDALKDKNRTAIEGSVRRNDYLLEFQNKNVPHREMFEIFKDISSPLFFTDYDNLFGTLHTFSYSYKDSRILTAIARSNQVLDLNFQEWVKGRNVNETILQGLLDGNSY